MSVAAGKKGHAHGEQDRGEQDRGEESALELRPKSKVYHLLRLKSKVYQLLRLVRLGLEEVTVTVANGAARRRRS